MIKWKPIEGFEGKYEISSTGDIASLPRYYKYGIVEKRKLLKPDIARGYKRVTLFKNGERYRYLVHRLVASAFVPNPDNKPVVNHVDENKLNNNVENLVWCTTKENDNWGNRNKLVSQKRSRAVDQYSKDGVFIKRWNSSKQVRETLGICQSEITRCKHDFTNLAGGYRWKGVETL